MYSNGNLSWLGAGTVLPEFRSRGANKALVEARIREGQTRGISTFAAEAAFSASVPVNTSYGNLKGFEGEAIDHQHGPSR
jgi:GNAT superfamily N-acetyltransferase